ncbi:hypothetical protein ACVU7I_07195, partial [Patulibacter sp. S7RM1-6]
MPPDADAARSVGGAPAPVDDRAPLPEGFGLVLDASTRLRDGGRMDDPVERLGELLQVEERQDPRPARPRAEHPPEAHDLVL